MSAIVPGAIRSLLLTVLICACAGTATAAGGRLPANAGRLDDLLAQGRLSDLSRAFEQVSAPDDLLLLLNWQEAKVLAGAGLSLSYDYSQTLARVAQAFPKGAADFRETGASFLVYAYALAVVDGLACENPYFAAARSNGVAAPSAGLWHYIATLSPDHGGFLIESALQTEAALEDKRTADDFLCGADGAKPKADLGPQRQEARAALNARVTAVVAGYRGK